MAERRHPISQSLRAWSLLYAKDLITRNSYARMHCYRRSALQQRKFNGVLWRHPCLISPLTVCEICNQLVQQLAPALLRAVFPAVSQPYNGAWRASLAERLRMQYPRSSVASCTLRAETRTGLPHGCERYTRNPHFRAEPPSKQVSISTLLPRNHIVQQKAKPNIGHITAFVAQYGRYSGTGP